MGAVLLLLLETFFPHHTAYSRIAKSLCFIYADYISSGIYFGLVLGFLSGLAKSFSTEILFLRENVLLLVL